ncbi:MAG: hypothetical protein KA419_02740 [Acidobacteria bacterium]|nr:hypothetical protein [Acidobacteriota bacterium]
MKHFQSVTLILLVGVLGVVLCGCGAADPGQPRAANPSAEKPLPPPKPSLWKVRVTGQKLLESYPDRPDVDRDHPVLALKVAVEYTGPGEAVISKGQLRLSAPSGSPCPLFAIGSGGNAFDQFNFHTIPGEGWFGGGYPSVDNVVDGRTVFGLRQPDAAKPPTLLFQERSQEILLGFVIPRVGGTFSLEFGDASGAPVAVAP